MLPKGSTVAERERDHHDRGERGAATECAQGELEVGRRAFQPWQATLVADRLGCLRHSA
jgi:hypothetical protein